MEEEDLVDTISRDAYTEGWVDAFLHGKGIGTPTEEQFRTAIEALEQYLVWHN